MSYNLLNTKLNKNSTSINNRDHIKYNLSVVRGRLVCWSRLVRRGGMVGFIFWVVGFTFISDISYKTIVMISGVSHSLDTAIGKSNLVRSSDGFTYFFQINFMIKLFAIS